MPGSKRRALKNLLSPNPSPADTPTPSSSINTASPPPPEPSHHHRTGSHGSFSSRLHLPSFGSKKESNLPRTSTGESINSDPANYLSDEQIDQNLSIERELSTQADVQVPQPQSGGVVVNAEELMYGNNGGHGKKGKKSSKQRFAERQARKQEAMLNSAPPNDPAWNAQLEKERQDEIRIISNACTVLGREIYEIAPDGHCMFNAIADQLYLQGLIAAHHATNPLFIRKTASKYMLAHPDDFLPFIPSITGEDSVGATDDGMMSEKDFKKYCSLVAETGEWGGEPEIQALSRHFSIPIHVIQSGPPTVVSHGGQDDSFGGVLTPEQSLLAGEKVVRISYHRRMYGLGEHYNSLRKAEA